MYFTAPRQVAVVEEPIAQPSAGELLVETIVSAISPGTELLVYRDEVPATMTLDASIPGLTGTSRFPMKYGYAAVGRVVAAGPAADGDWLGRLVFSMNPHESHFLAAAQDLLPVPDGIGADDAALFANVETAVTLTMDGRPMVGEHVAVFGQGVVGLLTTALLARFPLAGLVTVDLHPLRRRLSIELGAQEAVDPGAGAGVDAGERGFDLTYELSGSPDVLDQAIAVTRFHGRVVIGSWYGKRRAPVDLGGTFHRSRMQLVSSQVSTIDPALSGRWTSERRRGVAWSLLGDLRPARIVTHRVPLAAAADAYELLDRHPDEAVQILLTYGA
ncbi:MAG TPA: zinc-binding alcohol dehydrogenase [Solirubrobacteraceae bacterium]|nr:zinc-binding alcohol dehydrogenase [Solirubrobacteraceae bacterium]